MIIDRAHCFFVSIAFSLLLIIGGRAHASEWRDVDETESVILFQPAFISNWTPSISIKKGVTHGGHSEWMCWRGFGDSRANSCVTYQSMPRGFGNSVRSARDVIRYYDSFNDINVKHIGDSLAVDHELGGIDYRTFQYEIRSTAKYCLAFHMDMGTRRKVFDGWYCGPRSTKLNNVTITKMLSSLGIDGTYEPAKVNYSELSSPELTGWSDNRICTAAINRSNPPKWRSHRNYEAQVAEAMERGFSAQSCATLLNRPSTITKFDGELPSLDGYPTNEASRKLCLRAMGGSTDPHRWSDKTKNTNHVNLAKIREWTPELCAALLVKYGSTQFSGQTLE